MGNIEPPIVSVIVPNYNHEKYLKIRIDSILKQSLNNFEVIIIDDNSIDKSKEIISLYAETPKVKTFYNEQNSGNTFAQWNKGVNLAKAEFIWIAESDDFAHPDFLKNMVQVLEKNRNIGLVFCLSNYIDSYGKIIGRHSSDLFKLDKKKWRESFTENGRRLLLSDMISVNLIPNASAVLFRKDCFLSEGGANTDMKLCGDWLTWMKIMMNYDVGFISTPFNYYRHHQDTVRKKMYLTIDFLLEYLSCIKFIFSQLNIPETTKINVFIRFYIRFIKICLNYNRIFKKNKIFRIIKETSKVFGIFTCVFLTFSGTIAIPLSYIKKIIRPT